MFLATYVYCKDDPKASGGKICKRITKPIMVDSQGYAETLIIEDHKKRGEIIDGKIEFVGSLP